MKKVLPVLDFIIYWSIVLIPFAMAIAPAPMSIFMGFLIFAFVAKKIVKREWLFAKTGISLPLVCFFLITCISVFNSINIPDSVKGGVLRLVNYIFILFAVMEEVRDKKHVGRIIFAVALGLALTSIDGAWQVATGHGFIRKEYIPVLNIGLVRAISSFKDPNTFGIYLSALAPLIIGVSLYYYRGKEKVFFILLSILSLAGIILTYSRPTLLAIYIVLFFFGIVRKNKKFVALLIAFTLLAPFITPRSVKNWAKEVQYNPLRFMCNDDRIAVYVNSLNMIKSHPVIGVGTNAFMNSYKYYKQNPEYRNVLTLDGMKAHSIYLHFAGELGLVGIAIFFWLLFAIFREGKKIYCALQDHYLKIVSLSLIACLIAFLVNGLTESSLSYSRVALIFWYLAGFLLALKKFSYAAK